MKTLINNYSTPTRIFTFNYYLTSNVSPYWLHHTPNGRDVYLDFYIEAISQEILHSEINGKRHSNISKSEFASLRSLSRDDSIVIKKADKSGTIVIMKKCDYIAEVERQLHNSNY